MGLLDHLIHRPARAEASAFIPTQICSLASLLYPQFDRLDLQAGHVPVGGLTGSAWSRGYLLGTACASVQAESHIRFDDRFCFDRVQRAFSITYGSDEAADLIRLTIDECDAGDVDVLDGMVVGSSDMLGILGGDTETSGLEFWRFNQRAVS